MVPIVHPAVALGGDGEQTLAHLGHSIRVGDDESPATNHEIIV